MPVAGSAGGVDTEAVEFGGLRRAAEFLEGLSSVVVGSAVVGIVGNEGTELRNGRFEIAIIGMIEG